MLTRLMTQENGETGGRCRKMVEEVDTREQDTLIGWQGLIVYRGPVSGQHRAPDHVREEMSTVHCVSVQDTVEIDVLYDCLLTTVSASTWRENLNWDDIRADMFCWCLASLSLKVSIITLVMLKFSVFSSGVIWFGFVNLVEFTNIESN